MKKLKIFAALSFLIFLVVIVPGNSYQYETISFMELASHSDVIVDATIRGETGYSSGGNNSINTFEAMEIKKGNLNSPVFIAQGTIEGEVGSLWRLFLSNPVPIRVDANESPHPPVYSIIYTIKLGSPIKPISPMTTSTGYNSTPDPQIAYSNVLAIAAEPVEQNPEVLSFLRNSLYSQDHKTRLMALTELENIPVKDVLSDADIAQLFEILKSEKNSFGSCPDRLKVLSIFSRMGDRITPYIPKIIGELDGKKGQITANIIAEILLSQPPLKTIEILKSKLQDGNPFTNINAATVVRLLGKRKRGSLPTFCEPSLLKNLENGLNSEFSLVRQENLLTLGELGCEESANVLMSFYPTANYQEKKRILYGLDRIDTPEAHTFIYWARNNDPEPESAKFAGLIIAYPWAPFFDGVEHISE